MLKKQLKSLNIGSAKKINMQDSSSSDSDDDEEDRDVFMGDQSVPSLASKGIKKRKGLTRAHYVTMKREMKRRIKSGAKGVKRRAEKLSQMQADIIAKFKGSAMEM